jgi:hypothetical protein
MYSHAIKTNENINMYEANADNISRFHSHDHWLNYFPASARYRNAIKVIIYLIYAHIPFLNSCHIRRRAHMSRHSQEANTKEPCSWTAEGRPDRDNEFPTCTSDVLTTFRLSSWLFLFLSDSFRPRRSRTLFLARPAAGVANDRTTRIGTLLLVVYVLILVARIKSRSKQFTESLNEAWFILMWKIGSDV